MCDNYQKDIPENIKHDSHVINPTLFLHGILVTTDERLKRRVLVWADEKEINFSVMSPEEANVFLSNERCE